MNEKGIETITHKGNIIAIIIFGTYKGRGLHFLTPKEFPLQLGFHSHRAKSTIKAHTHNQVRRVVMFTQEVLLVKKGKVEVNLYDSDRQCICSRILKKGDAILLAGGGHGFTMLEDSEILEIKQGPYIDGKKDKIKFNGIEK